MSNAELTPDDIDLLRTYTRGPTIWDASSLISSVYRLEGAGLIERCPSPSNSARQLTQAGRDFLAAQAELAEMEAEQIAVPPPLPAGGYDALMSQRKMFEAAAEKSGMQITGGGCGMIGEPMADFEYTDPSTGLRYWVDIRFTS